jgi:hypothetical protein
MNGFPPEFPLAGRKRGQMGFEDFGRPLYEFFSIRLVFRSHHY